MALSVLVAVVLVRKIDVVDDREVSVDFLEVMDTVVLGSVVKGLYVPSLDIVVRGLDDVFL